MQHLPQALQDNPRYAELLQDRAIQEQLAHAYTELQSQQHALQDSHPFYKEELAHHRRKLTPTTDHATLHDDIQAFDSHNSEYQGTLDPLLTPQEQRDIAITDRRHYVLHAWEQILHAKIAKWLEQEQHKQARDYEQRLVEYLESLLAMKHLLQDLGESGELFGEAFEEMKQGLDVSNLGDEAYQKTQETNTPIGRGADNSADIKKPIDIRTIKQYCKAIQDSKTLREIAELLGRLEQEEEASAIQKINEQKSYSYTQIIPTKRYKEEICGVALGKDLENLLPQESAMLDDETLELLFDLKYIQNRLFCFEKQGYHSIEQEQQEKVEKEAERKNNKQSKKNEGAMIICVDTSGSMMGQPEYLAKALTLFLATKAHAQSRACYLINFATSIETMELSGRGGMAKLMQFLSMSFGGGTDVAKALREGLQKMQKEEFKTSDLLVISDGGFGHIPYDLHEKMHEQRQKGNKFYLLDIDGTSREQSMFDKHWVYSQTQDIKALHGMMFGSLR